LPCPCDGFGWARDRDDTLAVGIDRPDGIRNSRRTHFKPPGTGWNDGLPMAGETRPGGHATRNCKENTMADMITIDASALESFDYTQYIYDYFADLGTTAGTSSYYGGTYQSGYGYYNGSQVGFKYTGTTNDAQVLIEGSDLAYDGLLNSGASGHGISGTVDGFTLGSYDANTTYEQDDTAGTRSELTGVISGLVVSGLDLSAEIGDGTGSDNLVYQLYNALRKAGTTVDLDADGDSGYEYIDLIYSLLSSKAQYFIGSAGDDTYVGTDYGDLIDGGVGADSMAGGLGDDTYVVDDYEGDIVTELDGEGTDTLQTALDHYQINDYVENVVLTGTSNLWSYGNALDNTMTGNSGNNVLMGLEGDDTMIGGLGNDTYYVADSTDVVTELDGEGTDTVRSTVNHYQIGDYIENLTLSGSEGLTGYGNDLDNVLTGNSGANLLAGMAGDDTYVVSTDDTVSELNLSNEDAGGTDTVQSDVTFTLGDFLENLTLLSTGAVNGTGNALANVLTGNTANNTLAGLAGNDTLNGAAGNDTLTGAAGKDTIDGDEGKDILSGGAGSDDLYGGAGQDTLNGNAGADTFYFAAGDTLAAKGKADTIGDFNGKQGDLIDLASMDANENRKGNQSFDFIGTDKFSGDAGELRYQTVGGETYVYGDTDGDKKVDFTIHFDDALTLKDDFFLL